MTPASLTAVARHLLFIRETLGPNRGFWVNKLQREAGGKDGDSWCADFVSFVLDIAYMGLSPLPKTGSTQRMLDAARRRGWIVSAPALDCLYFFVHPDGAPHHVGIVTDIRDHGIVVGIAGNTSPDGTSVNGTGVFEHQIPTTNVVYARLP